MNAKTFQSLIFTHLGAFLDPGLCPGCGHNLDNLQVFCEICLQKLNRINHPCTLCGNENRNADQVCAACLYDPPRWQHLIAPLQYQGLTRELLMRFKFSESLELANSVIKTTIDSFVAQTPRPEVLIPVPLHRQRLMQRGYNQAFEIAKLLSRELAIPVDTKCLQRIRPTQAQAGLSAYKRQKNILKAFKASNQDDYQHVAVIDDIVTTGSTANEVTKTLHRVGIEFVEIWGLARVAKY